MAEIAARARALAEKMGGETFGESEGAGEVYGFPSLVPVKLIEQALLAERRLAMEAMERVANKLFGDTVGPSIRRAAEKDSL